MNIEDLKTLTDAWHKQSNRVNGLIDDELKEAQDKAYSLGLERGRIENKGLLKALKDSRWALEVANIKSPGPINDTIWYSGTETLFDFMDAAIEKAEA